MPNAWDVGSARILVSLGFEAIATTSSGHAASLGRMDQRVTLEELLAHVSALVGAVDVPVSVDAERCFADDAAGVAVSVERIAGTGAAGVSIEDYDPDSGIDPFDVAVERVAAAAAVTRSIGMVLTARAENHLYGVDDLDDTIARLTAYHQAGADVVYAPWLADIDQIAKVVGRDGCPGECAGPGRRAGCRRARRYRSSPRIDRRRPGIRRLRGDGCRRPGAAVGRDLHLHRARALH